MRSPSDTAAAPRLPHTNALGGAPASRSTARAPADQREAPRPRRSRGPLLFSGSALRRVDDRGAAAQLGGSLAGKDSSELSSMTSSSFRFFTASLHAIDVIKVGRPSLAATEETAGGWIW